MKKTSKIILFFVLTLIIILVTVLILLFGSKKNEKVEIDTVEDLYKQFVEKNKENGNYHYKLYGYTYDENQNVEMSIMQAYVENNKVYDMDGKEIGDYSDDCHFDNAFQGLQETVDYLLLSAFGGHRDCAGDAGQREGFRLCGHCGCLGSDRHDDKERRGVD